MTVQGIFVLLFFVVIFGKSQEAQIEVREDFAKFYEKFGVDGTFAFYDAKNDKYIIYNPSYFKEPFTPASTFKICNSLIGLETGVITDENFVIQWDSVMRQNPDWNKDQNLKTAFRNSTVWYYQELARKVGRERMKYWLDTVEYGNADTTGGIDKFWLVGGLRITPKQQIEFLIKLHDNNLPFSQRSMDIVKEIMIVPDSTNYIMRAKTGWGSMGKKDIGWYVGYIESKGNVYYFANCIFSENLENPDFARARKEIVSLILNEIKVFSGKSH